MAPSQHISVDVSLDICMGIWVYFKSFIFDRAYKLSLERCVMSQLEIKGR